MIESDTVTLPRQEYEALLARLADLEDIAAARRVEHSPRLPHAVAVAVMRGEHPVRAWRGHRGLSLRALAAAAGVSSSYLSEIERGAKPGSVEALHRLAQHLDTSIECLLAD